MVAIMPTRLAVFPFETLASCSRLDVQPENLAANEARQISGAEGYSLLADCAVGMVSGAVLQWHTDLDDQAEIRDAILGRTCRGYARICRGMGLCVSWGPATAMRWAQATCLDGHV